MLEHYDRWLGAYLDGELPEYRKKMVETHLEKCLECQAKLASMKKLSELIQNETIQPDIPSPEYFASQVMKRLLSRKEPGLERFALEVVWWLAPFVIFGAWVFVQATFLLTGWLGTDGWLKLLGDAVGWLVPTIPSTTWLTSLVFRLGFMPDTTGLMIMQQIEAFSRAIFNQMVWQISIALLYCGWLAIWLVRNRKQTISTYDSYRV